jgi:hypothetical protein
MDQKGIKFKRDIECFSEARVVDEHIASINARVQACLDYVDNKSVDLKALIAKLQEELRTRVDEIAVFGTDGTYLWGPNATPL